MKKLSQYIDELKPERKGVYQILDTYRGVDEMYDAAFRHGVIAASKVAKGFEQYIEQLEGLADSMLPREMVLNLRKECGIE